MSSVADLVKPEVITSSTSLANLRLGQEIADRGDVELIADSERWRPPE